MQMVGRKKAATCYVVAQGKQLLYVDVRPFSRQGDSMGHAIFPAFLSQCWIVVRARGKCAW